MTERHCNHWVPIIHESTVASPGGCVGQSKDRKDLEKYRGKRISECVCYTCPHNTLVLGYGYDGQGA